MSNMDLDYTEKSYWMALSHHGIETKKKNDVIVYCYKNKIKLSDFLDSNAISNLVNLVGWRREEANGIKYCIKTIDNYKKSLDNLLNNRVVVLPITSPIYPKKVKEYLDSDSPLLLYYKGNIDLLNGKSILVANRHSVPETIKLFISNLINTVKEYRDIALFSDNETLFDRYLLNEITKNNVTNILFITQGLEYYLKKEVHYLDNRGLTISISPPNIGWQQSNFFIKSAIVCCLASRIYVADILDKDNIWPFLVSWSKHNNKEIYCRLPYKSENSDNYKLIYYGAQKVDDRLRKL